MLKVIHDQNVKDGLLFLGDETINDALQHGFSVDVISLKRIYKTHLLCNYTIDQLIKLIVKSISFDELFTVFRDYIIDQACEFMENHDNTNQ